MISAPPTMPDGNGYEHADNGSYDSSPNQLVDFEAICNSNYKPQEESIIEYRSQILLA